MKETRPWGSYEVLIESPGCKIKRIEVNPGGKLSMQKHKYRNEFWIMVEGVGILTHEEVTMIFPGECHYIPQGDIHRMENPSTSRAVVFYEVQTGDRLEEDDIERVLDEYGRV